MVKNRLLNVKKYKNGAARLEKISMDNVDGEEKKGQNTVYEEIHFTSPMVVILLYSSLI